MSRLTCGKKMLELVNNYRRFGQISASTFRAKNLKKADFSRPTNVTDLYIICLTHFALKGNNVTLLREKIFMSRLTCGKTMLGK